jgi:nucleotide-binding universal stress UspA family protein
VLVYRDDATVPSTGSGRHPVENPFASAARKCGAAPITVALVGRDAETGMRGTIVCGITATPEARAAAQLAGALAARLGLRLVLVHVVDAREDDDRIGAVLEAAAGSLPSDTEVRVVDGNRIDALARIAADEGADMIVLGARAHGARGRQLRCELARQLEAVQAAPVLIAPPATRARSGRRLGLVGTPPQR